MSSKSLPKDTPIVIVGAGVFGLTTAMELRTRGYTHITVLDRFLPPVPDGSSVDVSRIIRSDYADPVYAKMGRDAIQRWRTAPEFAGHYHESGFVMLASTGGGVGNAWLDKVSEVAKANGVAITEYDDARDVRGEYPAAPSDFSGHRACVNHRGGWADAKGAVAQLAARCSLLGVHFITGPRGTVTSLKFDSARKAVIGVNVAEGPAVLAKQVILATGAWTNTLIPITHASSASGQPVGFIELTDEEAHQLRDMPVIINMSTGVFIFPPTPGRNSLLKVARHGYGYATQVRIDEDRDGDGAGSKGRTISSPKRDGSNAASGYIPDDADEGLREGLRQLAPAFAARAWSGRRLCWYSDTPEGDFIMDHHPSVEGVFVATGGAGHAFKFLPVLGAYIVDCLEDKAPRDLRYKWRLREAAADGKQGRKQGDGSRGGPPLRRLTPAEQAKL